MDKGLLCKLSYINRISTPVYRGRTALSHAEIKVKQSTVQNSAHRFSIQPPTSTGRAIEHACERVRVYDSDLVVEDRLSTINPKSINIRRMSDWWMKNIYLLDIRQDFQMVQCSFCCL